MTDPTPQPQTLKEPSPLEMPLVVELTLSPQEVEFQFQVVSILRKTADFLDGMLGPGADSSHLRGAVEQWNARVQIAVRGAVKKQQEERKKALEAPPPPAPPAPPAPPEP